MFKTLAMLVTVLCIGTFSASANDYRHFKGDNCTCRYDAGDFDNDPPPPRPHRHKPRDRVIYKYKEKEIIKYLPAPAAPAKLVGSQSASKPASPAVAAPPQPGCGTITQLGSNNTAICGAGQSVPLVRPSFFGPGLWYEDTANVTYMVPPPFTLPEILLRCPWVDHDKAAAALDNYNNWRGFDGFTLLRIRDNWVRQGDYDEACRLLLNP